MTSQRLFRRDEKWRSGLVSAAGVPLLSLERQESASCLVVSIKDNAHRLNVESHPVKLSNQILPKVSVGVMAVVSCILGQNGDLCEVCLLTPKCYRDVLRKITFNLPEASDPPYPFNMSVVPGLYHSFILSVKRRI